MATSPAPLRDDRGETLVEVLVAVVILGIAGVAILAGLQLSITVSDIHRKQSTAGAYVRSFAEQIENHVARHGLQCSPATYEAVTVPDLPDGYTPAVEAVQSWNGSGWGACTPDGGVQQLELTVSSPQHRGDETLYLVLRKPCDPSAPCTS